MEKLAVAADPNVFVWTSDWHVVSTDVEQGGTGDTKPSDAEAVCAFIRSLNPAGVIDTGDCKDHYGPGTGDELDNYVQRVGRQLPWAKVNPGSRARWPILPGNHDELDDYYPAGVTDFSLFDRRFWGAPYHWTCDWDEARIRFVAFHCAIIHGPSNFKGFFSVDTAELDWLEQELAWIPHGWKAAVCSHAPGDPAFGNEIRSEFGGARLRQILARWQPRVAFYLNGHRHGNLGLHVLDGVPHFNGPGVSYTIGNARGGFVVLRLDPAARTVTFRYHQGPPSTFPEMPVSVYTPVTIQLGD